MSKLRENVSYTIWWFSRKYDKITLSVTFNMAVPVKYKMIVRTIVSKPWMDAKKKILVWNKELKVSIADEELW